MLDEVLNLLHRLDSIEAWHHEVSEHVRNSFIFAYELGVSHDKLLSIVDELASIKKADLFKLLLDYLHIV